MQQIYGLQWDSTSTLPIGGAITAFYFNGSYAHRPVTYGRGRVWVDVTGAAPLDCHWLDIEPGDATVSDFPAWNQQRHLAGLGWGGAYVNRGELPELSKTLSAIPAMHADLWLSTLDGTIPDAAELELPPNLHLIAIQAFPVGMTGFHADCSVVVDADYWGYYHA